TSEELLPLRPYRGVYPAVTVNRVANPGDVCTVGGIKVYRTVSGQLNAQFRVLATNYNPVKDVSKPANHKAKRRVHPLPESDVTADARFNLQFVPSCLGTAPDAVIIDPTNGKYLID